MNTSPRDFDESKCEFVSCLGIAKSCMYYSSRQEPTHATRFLHVDTNVFEDVDISKLEGNLVIQLCHATFYKVLNSVSADKVKLVIVLNNEDYTFPDHYLTNENFELMIKHPCIVHMFAQNCVIEHPKISRIPIGLRYHFFSSMEYQYRCPELVPILHEQHVKNIRNNALPFWERKMLCYCNFQFRLDTKYSRYAHDRHDVMNKVNKDLCFFIPETRKTVDCYREMADHAFVISPMGNGIDCYRTWEALVLGCIPIVKKQSIQSLFDDLPVLIVDDWSDINTTLLRMTIEHFKTKKFNMDKLTLRYWKNLIYSKLN